MLENSTSVSSMISGAGPGHQMINTGSCLSMMQPCHLLFVSAPVRVTNQSVYDVSELAVKEDVVYSTTYILNWMHETSKQTLPRSKLLHWQVRSN